MSEAHVYAADMLYIVWGAGVGQFSGGVASRCLFPYVGFWYSGLGHKRGEELMELASGGGN